MRQNNTIKSQIFFILALFSSITGLRQPLCTWNPEKKGVSVFFNRNFRNT
jgi:hypothetical protein